MEKSKEKTNVMRLLDQKQIDYTPHYYDPEVTDGLHVALSIGENPEQVFKTLVTQANTKEYFVFVIPVNSSLNLKKAANAAQVKSIEMIPQKELLPLTGYIHGGCSPIGMKKPFRTYIEELSQLFPQIYLSAGKRGAQIAIAPQALTEMIAASFADLT